MPEEIKEKFRGTNNPRYGIVVSAETRKKISEGNKGKTVTKEVRKRISETQKGENGYWFNKKRSDETKKKMSKSAKGRKLSDETKKKMSKAKKGQPSWCKGKSFVTTICPHCKKEGAGGAMKRWHFDNCKFNQT